MRENAREGMENRCGEKEERDGRTWAEGIITRKAERMDGRERMKKRKKER